MDTQSISRVGFTEARRKLTRLYNEVEDGGVVVVERHNSKPMVLIGEDELRGFLAENYPLANANVSFHGGQVSMWLDQLPVHAVGATFEEAAEGLADASLAYANSWRTDLRFAPNHSQNAGWVRRIELAPDRESLIDLLLGE